MNIAERMTKKADDAREQIRGLLWKGGDPDAIADAAIAGGLSPAAVAKIEDEVTAAKAAIACLKKYDLAALKTDAESAAKTARDTEAVYESARDAYHNASMESRNKAGALSEAREAHIDIAQRVIRGDLPAKGLPAAVKSFIAWNAAHDEQAKVEHDLVMLKSEILKTSNRADALAEEADKLKKQASEMNAVQGLRLVPLADDYKCTVKTMRQQIEAGKKRVALLEQALAAAVKKTEEARAALPW